MKRLPLVVVVLLLTTTMGAGIVPLSGGTGGEGQADAVDSQTSYSLQRSDEPEPNGGMTNVLSIPAASIDRSDLRRQHADLGPAAGFDTDETTDQLLTRTLERELESTPRDERETRIEDELEAIEAEISQLESRERTAAGEFSAGQMTPRAFVTELAAIHLRATTLNNRVAILEEQAAALSSEVVSNSRLQTIEYDLRMLEGPLRAHAVEVLRGERPANRIMIETGDTGIAMTAIDDGQYLREIHRKGLHGQGTAELPPEQAIEIIQQQYPLLWDRATSWSADGPGPVMMVDVNFDRGGLRSFIDSPTQRPIIEHQRLPLDTIVTGETTTKEQDGLNVSVDQTYAGGPLRLTITDASTGEPVTATVTVAQNGDESQTVGTTDENGVLWTVSPRGPFTITVFGEDTSAAFVDITPPAPETVLTAE